MTYSVNKEAFINYIDYKAGYSGIRIVKALTPKEWESAKKLRQYYFSNNRSAIDPGFCTFEHKEHIHLVLYRGTAIAGYAHLQVAPEAQIRIIVIDNPYQGSGIDEQFSNLCERWLKQQEF